MTPAQVIQELRLAGSPIPFKALNAAMDQPDAAIPGLLAILEELLADPGGCAEDEDFNGHFPALFLLAQFRETRALPLIQALLRLPDELQDALLGDLVTEGLASLLASTCGGDPGPLTGLAADPALNPFVRGAAMDAILVLAFQDRIPRERMEGCFATLFRQFEARGEGEDPVAWALLASCMIPARVPALVRRLVAAFERGVVDEDIITLEDVQDALTLNEGHGRRSFLQDHHLVEDAILELWGRARAFPELAAFEEDAEDFGPDPVPPLAPAAIAAALAAQGTRVAQPGRPSRNGPCPCGSGKKYKRCCGQ